MGKTVSQLTSKELEQYDPTRNLDKGLDPQRWVQAQARLPQLVALLKEEFGATRVRVFGSLLDQGCYMRWSDIDLAVWGILPERYYSALEAVNELSPDIKVDLVEPGEFCSAALRCVIEKEGIDV